MKSKLHHPIIKKILFITPLLIVGLSELLFIRTDAQVIWETIDSLEPKSLPLNWESPVSDPNQPTQAPAKWQIILESDIQDQSPPGVVWELLETEDKSLFPPSQTIPNSLVTPPSNLEDAEALLRIIPLSPGDYTPLLRISPLVSTAETLPIEQWQIAFTTTSPFASKTGTGNQNYSVNIDIGFNDRLLLSLFMSEADNPLTAPLNGFSTQPSNLWQSYGASARWQVMNENNWKFAISGSLEGWNVSSGGSNSPTDTADDTSPNIFNNSGRRVFTRNIVGSLNLPVSWQASNHWQFSFSPGVSFLPTRQGAGQGGAGTFYGTNPYVSGGVLFQPFPELGFTASLAKPIGSGTNSFDANLEFSRVPVYSAGINWNLNPRIGLQGLITNGFGATPTTALLTLPSDNRLSYSTSFVYTPGTADTPQVALTPRQLTLAKGGITVNTALVPPNETTVSWMNADNEKNLNYSIGHSLSNSAQLNLSSGYHNNAPQTAELARNFANDRAWNWRMGGKIIALSPLRGAPFWGGGYVSIGRSIDNSDKKAPAYLFAETIATLELNKNIAININPKLAFSGIGTRWGLGLSSNIQLFPNVELLPEANIAINRTTQSNATLGLRWQATDSFSIDVYASTAASMLDIGQLISAEKVRLGTRAIFTF